MNKTGIEWATRTWNPVTGCTKVSPGCANCYAEVMAKRLQAMGTPGYENGFNHVVCHENRLGQPAKVKKPQIVFCCSMSDLFHKDVPDLFIAAVFGAIYIAPQHEFIVLTKRPERIARLIGDYYISQPPRNLRIGVSVENQVTATDRIRILMRTAKQYGSKTMVSAEPLLSRIYHLDYQEQMWNPRITPGWIVAGCESGSGRRRVHNSLFWELKSIALESGVPFFLKQMEVNGKVVSMPELDGRVWDQMPPELAAIRKLNGGDDNETD